MLLFVFDFLQFSSLIIFIIIAYQVLASNIQLERPSSASRSLSDDFVFTIDSNGDATAEGRTARM